ncbi:MAG: type II secretion system F family protein [Candidatus Kerfeldbacteria bacterium]
MPEFNYKARDPQGNLVEGVLEAPSEAVLQEVIRGKNLILLESHKKGGGFSIASISLTGVKAKDVVLFARQLSVLISATVPIVRALRILIQQVENKKFQDVISAVADDVDSGARLSAAMHKHEKVFDDFFVYMIRAGETTGRLDEVLEYLADQKEKDYQLRSKIISSMIYPVFIVAALGGVFIFMMIFVIPNLLDVVAQSGTELPLVTRILVWVSHAITSYWWLIIIVIGGLAGGYLFAINNPAGKTFIGRAKLHIPIIGTIFRKIYLARLSRSLGNLLASGVPVNQAITIVGDVVGNDMYKSIMQKAVKDVEGGQPLSKSLEQSKYIPLMLSQMVSVGEETGKMDQILAKISDFYTSEVESLTGALVSIVEPIIMLVLGAGALILIAGILLPIYQVTENI